VERFFGLMTELPPGLSFRLSRLFHHLDSQIDKLSIDIEHATSVKPSYNDSVFIISLQLDKLNANMDKARSIVLDLEKSTNATSSPPLLSQSFRSSSPLSQDNSWVVTQHRQHLKQLNDRMHVVQRTVRTVREQENELYKQYIAQQHLQQQEVIADEVQSQSTLKQRRPSMVNERETSSTSVGKNMSVESKLAVQRNTQESLSNEILSMVQTMRRNALTFGEKIARDNNLVESTSNALNKSAANMNKVEGRLSTYHKMTAIGWRFYILAVVFLFVSLVMGMTIIRLFPKW
jgi:hypothetical protein